MKNSLRWGGIIGFVAITALLLVIGFFLLDNWAKRAIEAAGLSVNRAEVDVAKVDLTLSPIGFDIGGIEIADADKPTHNALQIERAKLDINLPQLLLGNIRINDLYLSGIETDVARGRPAKVIKAAEGAGKVDAAKNAVKNKVDALGAALPKPETVLAQRTEHTRAAVDEAKNTLQSAKTSITAAVKDIPSDTDIKDYRQRMAKIEANKLESLEAVKEMAAQIKTLGQEVAADKQAIVTAKQTIDSAIESSKTAVNQVAKAPEKDWQQLKQDYPLNASSAMKVAELLLGEKFFTRLQQAQYWYAKAKPWLARLQSDATEEESAAAARSQGLDIRFYDPDPSAKLQMDRGELQFKFDGWPWLLQVTNLVSGPSAAGKPLQLLLKRGSEAAGFEVEGEIQRTDKKNRDTFVFRGNGIDFSQQTASVGGSEVLWVPETANVKGEVVANDGQLDGKVVLDFPANNFKVMSADKNGQYLQSVLAQVTRFDVTISVAGKVRSPAFKVASTLDNQVSRALQNVLKQEYEQWLAQMQDKLRNQAKSFKAPLDDSLGGLNRQKEAADAQVKRFEEEVERELEALRAKLAKKQQELENKVKGEAEKQKNKLKDKLKKEAGSFTDRFNI